MGLCAMVLPFSLMLAGCDGEEAVGISKIEKTSSDGLVDTYTIYYTDGTTTTFDVTNGKDGESSDNDPTISISDDGYWIINGEKTTNKARGEDVSISDVYNKYCEEYGPTSYEEFLKEYLTFDNSDNSVVIANCLRSVLKVNVEHCITQGITNTNTISLSSGSAVIYKMESEYTYIVTNYHVVYNSSGNIDNIIYSGSRYMPKSIKGYLYGSEGGPYYDKSTVDANGYPVYEYGDESLDLEYIGGAMEKDLAVLRVKTSDILAINPDAIAVTLADEYHVGDTAIAIGNPEGEGISVTEGIISVDGDIVQLDIDNDSNKEAYTSIRIDTSLYHGSSGGGLFDASGKLIAITNAGNEEDEHINYAVPLDIVRSTVDNILYYHKETGGVVSPKKLVVGINGIDMLNSKYVYNESTGHGEIVETIAPLEIVADSIAEEVGLQAGDILHSIYINETEFVLKRYYEIADVMMSAREGDKIKFKYTRGASLPTESIAYTVLATDLVSLV